MTNWIDRNPAVLLVIPVVVLVLFLIVALAQQERALHPGDPSPSDPGYFTFETDCCQLKCVKANVDDVPCVVCLGRDGKAALSCDWRTP